MMLKINFYLMLLLICSSCGTAQVTSWQDFKGDNYIESLREKCHHSSDEFNVSFVFSVDVSEIKNLDKGNCKLSISSDYLLYYGEISDTINFTYKSCDSAFFEKLHLFTVRLIDKTKRKQMIFSCKDPFQFNNNNKFSFRLKRLDKQGCNLFIKQGK